jgi:hypothetical protein
MAEPEGFTAVLSERKKSVSGYGRRWLAAVAVGALALSTLVVGAETVAASGLPAACFSPVSAAPSPAPLQIGGVYQIASKENLIWVSWATSPRNSGPPTRTVALAASYTQTAGPAESPEETEAKTQASTGPLRVTSIVRSGDSGD